MTVFLFHFVFASDSSCLVMIVVFLTIPTPCVSQCFSLLANALFTQVVSLTSTPLFQKEAVQNKSNTVWP